MSVAFEFNHRLYLHIYAIVMRIHCVRLHLRLYGRPEVDYEAFTYKAHPAAVRLAAVQSVIQIYLAYDRGELFSWYIVPTMYLAPFCAVKNTAPEDSQGKKRKSQPSYCKYRRLNIQNRKHILAS